MKFVPALILAGLFAVSGLSVSAPSAADGSALVASKCSACHSMKRICRGIGKKDLTAWEKTNARMVKMGLNVSDEEIALVNNYLANVKPGENTLCK
ncbi:c-type cytochrome [Maridesulfovibrio hydrothermalis]|uniref:Cytochrome c domain-containing protein n=1 Tax=Maridesulfovibrio hydrothermalis AM13 = DSM 14728 TaxID=1121451 RepID=L0RH37_9BACT|nr:hypothetical protein [Maridesulfovibrio hydrothermalis]CCO24891.1 conserved exported protein of unknown function [Maridesulfovibrio hydrothermalis AM13 = DSM 14728]